MVEFSGRSCSAYDDDIGYPLRIFVEPFSCGINPVNGSNLSLSQDDENVRIVDLAPLSGDNRLMTGVLYHKKGNLSIW